MLFGHYWFSGRLRTRGSHAACVDYSAGKGGPLMGPKLFSEFLLPHYRRYIEHLLRAGHPREAAAVGNVPRTATMDNRTAMRSSG